MKDGNTAFESSSTPTHLGFFERYLSIWVIVCMGVGVLFGKLFPRQIAALSSFEFGTGSQVNVPIAMLIWLMIFPMMLKIDFGSLLNVTRKPKGLAVTLIINWLVKPFTMAALAWIFLQNLFLPVIGEVAARQYSAGLIILAAAPCTAMVFVWSQLTRGDPAYTLVQVAVNDLIMLVAFAPIVMFLLGISNVVVPTKVLLISVVVFIAIPLAAGVLTRYFVINRRGLSWFESNLIPIFQPITVIALLLTLVLIFAFQAKNLTSNFLPVLLIAIPIIIQVYLNSGVTYLLMYSLKVPHRIASPGALIGASNFFELAVAVAITLFGPASNAALATVVGVLVEVPVMLSVCAVCNRTVDWYGRRVEV